jgi:transposase
MVHKDQSRRKYPSDLTDAQWAIVRPLIPPAKQHPRGGNAVDLRHSLMRASNVKVVID